MGLFLRANHEGRGLMSQVGPLNVRLERAWPCMGRRRESGTSGVCQMLCSLAQLSALLLRRQGLRVRASCFQPFQAVNHRLAKRIMQLDCIPLRLPSLFLHLSWLLRAGTPTFSTLTF